MAIHLENDYFNFEGNLQATAGSVTYGTEGSPGTVYIQSTVGNDVTRLLKLDNVARGNEAACGYPTYLDEPGATYEFNEVDLRRRACLRLKSVSIEL